MDDNTELYHYGVKGMKWGVRKEQQIRKKARKHEYKSKVASTQIQRDTHAGKAIRLTRKADNLALQRLSKDKRLSKADRQLMQNKKDNANTGKLKRILTSNATEGRMARYRLKGDSNAKAALKAYGTQALHAVEVSTVGAAGVASLVLLLG